MIVTDYNEQFLDKRGTDHLIDELKAYIDSISTGNVDLSDYVTKSELQAKLDALNINIDLSSYATKEELTQAINSIDLSSYAKKTDIPSLNGYALKTEIPNKVSKLENDSGYLSSIPEEYVTETELNAKGYLTEHQDLSAYALKTEIPTVPSLDGYATTEYVDNAIANVPSGGNVDLSNYYTKAETNALIPSTDGLATTQYVDNAVSNIPTTDLSNYYTKNETYSKTEVDTLVANSGGSSSGGSSGGVSDVYSTEETAIGTWIDGKTIYRKVIEVGKLASVSSGNYSTVTTTFSDVACGELLRTTGIIKYGTTTHIVVDGGFSNLQLNPSTTHSTYINNVEKSRLTLIGSSTSVKLWYGADWGGYNYTLVVEYTKSA